MKNILHLTLFLAIVSAIAGGFLGFANSITAPIIAENALKAERSVLKEIYPDVSDDAFTIEKENVSDTIEKIFAVEGKGYVFKLNVTGYKDGTTFLVAFDDQGTIIDYMAISNGDTSGIGTKVCDDAFRQTLIGKDGTSDEILNDTITGATVSSTPVVSGILEAATYQMEKLK